METYNEPSRMPQQNGMHPGMPPHMFMKGLPPPPPLQKMVHHQMNQPVQHERITSYGKVILSQNFSRQISPRNFGVSNSYEKNINEKGQYAIFRKFPKMTTFMLIPLFFGENYIKHLFF